MPTNDDYLAAAWEVAPAYGLTPTSISVLAQSENVVCKIVTDDRRAVMRFHRPGYTTLDDMKSEVEWVKALGEAGLPVPEAIQTIDGHYYVEVEVDGVAIQVGAVAWVSGQPVKQAVDLNDPALAAHYRSIGVLAAKIRKNADSWSPPAGFSRRRWDNDGLVGDDPLWGRFWEADGLTADQQQVFIAVRDQLREELAATSTGPDRFGLIHADLHLGNVMSDGDSLTVIDFDDAGYGWFMYELAVALFSVLESDHFGECKHQMLEGYRSVVDLDESEATLIDMFLVVRALVNIGWLDARRELTDYEWFAADAAKAASMARRYLLAP